MNDSLEDPKKWSQPFYFFSNNTEHSRVRDKDSLHFSPPIFAAKKMDLMKVVFIGTVSISHKYGEKRIGYFFSSHVALQHQYTSLEIDPI